MYFPVSGVDISPFIPPAVAFAVSFCTSMGGVSGAFLLLPFQMSVLGYTHPSVSATNQFYNVISTPGGIYRYIREGRMLWPLALAVIAGTLPGVFIGAAVRIVWLPNPGNFKLFAALVLFYIGARLLSGQRGTKQPEKIGTGGADGKIRVLEASPRRIAYAFQGNTHACPTFGIIGLSLAVGVVGGIYGVGGGAIIAPFLIAWYGLPVHSIGGATLMGTLATSLAAVLFFLLLAPLFPEQQVKPDFLLGLLFGFGGTAGMYLGARCQKHVRPLWIKRFLTMLLLGTACRYIYEYFA